MSTDAFVAVAASLAPSLVQSVATKPNPAPENGKAASVASSDVPDPKPEPVTNKEQLQAAVQQIQKYITDSQRTLEFHIDESSGTPVVTVRDSNGDLIRQIPNAETLHIAQMLKDHGAIQHGILNLTA
jgi:flagellar protein FlaG